MSAVTEKQSSTFAQLRCHYKFETHYTHLKALPSLLMPPKIPITKAALYAENLSTFWGLWLVGPTSDIQEYFDFRNLLLSKHDSTSRNLIWESIQERGTIGFLYR